MAESLVITVAPTLEGLRLDRGLADALPDRSQLFGVEVARVVHARIDLGPGARVFAAFILTPDGKVAYIDYPEF